MSHFICTGGCKGVSDHQKNCETPDCPHYGQPLIKCECPDGEHGGAFDRFDLMEDSESDEK